jgi:hypothetical protein
MRRIAGFGVGVMVLIVLFGAFASSAFAEEEPPAPYWAECLTVAKGTGHYEMKCAHTNPFAQGNYELKAGIGHGGGFTGKASGQEPPHLFMQTASGLVKVECKKGTVTGKYGLPNRMDDVVFTFGKCHGTGTLIKQKCTSPGASAGTIQVSPMGGESGYTYLEAPNASAGFRLESEAEPEGPITQFSCGSELEVRVAGRLIVEALGGVGNSEASKHLNLFAHPSAMLGELEYSGKKYTPETDELGWWNEVNEIKLGERAPHVLVDELCGPYIQQLEGESCTPPLYMGVDFIFVAKGETLRLVQYEGG